MFSNLFVLLIKGYQYLVSPFLSPACRFYPSCSNYSIQAITKFGSLKGIFLSMKRLLRCHPFHPGGFDPVD